MCVWCQYTNKAEGVFSLVRSVRKILNMLPASHPFRNARGIFILVRFVCASSVKLSDSYNLVLDASTIRLRSFVCMIAGQDLVGALSLDVTWLLALVASSLRGGLGWAVSGEMSDFATVVALLTLGAVTYAS